MRSKPTRCISPPTCGRRSRCWLGLPACASAFRQADSVAALVVAVLICIAGWRLGRRTIDTLTDAAPRGAASQIRTVAARVPGVVSVERVRAREVGDKTFVDLGVAVNRTLPLDRVSALKDRGRRRHPQADAGCGADASPPIRWRSTMKACSTA